MPLPCNTHGVVPVTLLYKVTEREREGENKKENERMRERERERENERIYTCVGYYH